MNWINHFLDNLKEKKTTIMGIITMVISLAVMLFPKVFVNVSGEDVTHIVGTGYDLIAAIFTFVSGLLLTVSRMFPKE